jgi:preprotein translocase subunit YajC
MEQLEGLAPMILFLVLMVAAIYFLMIRPQRKRQKEQQELLERIRSGEKVITSSGIYGQVESVSEDTIVLKLESGATIRVAKSTVVAKQVK